MPYVRQRRTPTCDSGRRDHQAQLVRASHPHDLVDVVERDEVFQGWLKAIIRRLQDQHPEKSALTFAGELQELANETGSRVEEHRGGDVTVVEPKKPN
jgi:hypothetical protein